jgi:hypothetical protein
MVAERLRDDPHFKRVIFCCFGPASLAHHERALREVGKLQ